MSELNAKVGRRSFLKMAAIAGAFGATAGFASEKVTRAATEEEVKNPFPGSKKVKTICTSCSVGCGVIAEVQNGVWVRQEVAQDHPISFGGHCCKGADMIDMVRSEVRLKYPMEKVNGQWKRISWEDALNRISTKLDTLRKTHGPDSVQFLGSAKVSTEMAYYIRKFAAFFGTNNIDHQARVCHSSTVAGVANTWGYGAMTNSLNDMLNSKCMFVLGSNPAVAHPVGFGHMLKAKERNNAQLIVVDPCFTKTAAKADFYARIRPGTDIAFVYGLLHIIFKNGWEDKKFIEERTYAMDEVKKEALKWTPEVTSDVTGIAQEDIIQIATMLVKHKPGTLIWAMGLTQHTVGTGNTRIGPILQLVLGNMGKEGGGCNILRGHDNVQGSTDMCCLPDSLPGYYGLAEGSWKYFAKQWKVDYEWLQGRFKSKEWMEKPGFTMARWWAGVLDGKNGNDAIENAGTNLKALVNIGNGITSISQQAKVKEGLDHLELLVIADPFANEAAILTDKQNDVFLLPMATQFENSGMVTATNRSAQWRYKVVEPLYESKNDQEFLFELAKRLGFYNEYTQSLGDGKGNFQWPEDATNEIARTIKTIGLGGWTAERVKKHTDNWHMFDEVTLEGKGPMKGEFYGLPWPCWNETHAGSPILYNIDKPVKEGGMGFRNRYGLEHNGVSQLAGDGVTLKGAKVKGGYPEITKANIEAVLGITLSEAEKAAMGANWKVDTSGLITKKCLEAGITPNGNARARCIVWEWSKFEHALPLHREPLRSMRHDLVSKYPSFKDRPKQYRVDTKFESLQKEKDWSKEFPIGLVTGRLVNMMGAGLENRASKYIAALAPEMFCDIHPDLAHKHGIKNGHMMWVYSPDGTKVKVKAKYTHRVSSDRVFMPFHFAGHFQGEDLSAKYPTGTKPYAIGESACTVTNYGYDIITQIPETKVGLCRIEKA
ncbi:MAG: formate dehydrogenase subunit alpha [Campylobacterales bacterium]|nr:formate dehydrogenase subunit alpha [Campylobacterales bacterium]MBN2833113.1 formate dehydrogenase subunit alpha [Campylobacterales bacterium]